jgi:hypothetical protein
MWEGFWDFYERKREHGHLLGIMGVEIYGLRASMCVFIEFLFIDPSRNSFTEVIGNFQWFS